MTEDSDLQPCFVAFDLLYLNGERLTDRKQSERFEKLKKLIRPVSGRLLVAEEKSCSKNEQVQLRRADTEERKYDAVCENH